MNTINLNELPLEVEQTISMIKSGVQMPFAQDGIEFKNRESVLPAKKSKYYKEFTVKTPDSLTRGMRRLVIGKSKEIYYTEDHYTTFVLIA